MIPTWVGWGIIGRIVVEKNDATSALQLNEKQIWLLFQVPPVLFCKMSGNVPVGPVIGVKVATGVEVAAIVDVGVGVGVADVLSRTSMPLT